MLDMPVYPIHTAPMELASYLALTSQTDAEFAQKVGRERSTVTRWRLRKTRPDWTAMAAIERVTEGAVTSRDFMDRMEAAQ